MTTPETQALELLKRAFVTIPFNRMLGLQLGDATPEKVTMTFSMKEDLIGNFMHGILHGGVISSVLDMAGGSVAMMAAIKKHAEHSVEKIAEILGKSSTIDLQISYLRPGKGTTFTAIATLIKSGNKISFTRMELYSDNQTLLATGSGTYMIG